MGVQAKILSQDICIDNLDWEEANPEDKVASWEEWIYGLSQVRTMKVTRCIHNHTEREILSYQLHGFVDGSQKAYYAAVYLVYVTTWGIFLKLLYSKFRVAPLKQLSSPHLELFSADILANLICNSIYLL